LGGKIGLGGLGFPGGPIFFCNFFRANNFSIPISIYLGGTFSWATLLGLKGPRTLLQFLGVRGLNPPKGCPGAIILPLEPFWAYGIGHFSIWGARNTPRLDHLKGRQIGGPTVPHNRLGRAGGNVSRNCGHRTPGIYQREVPKPGLGGIHTKGQRRRQCYTLGDHSWALFGGVPHQQKRCTAPSPRRAERT